MNLPKTLTAAFLRELRLLARDRIIEPHEAVALIFAHHGEADACQKN